MGDAESLQWHFHHTTVSLHFVLMQYFILQQIVFFLTKNQLRKVEHQKCRIHSCGLYSIVLLVVWVVIGWNGQPLFTRPKMVILHLQIVVVQCGTLALAVTVKTVGTWWQWLLGCRPLLVTPDG